MNSLHSLIIKTPNNHKRTSLTMSTQSNSVINSLPIVNDYFVKFYTFDHRSMFDEQLNCINQRKDVHRHQHRRSAVITNNKSSNFRTAIRTTYQQQHMKRYQHHRGYISNHFSSKQRLMISLDHHDQTIDLMQSHPTPVNHLLSSAIGIESNSLIDENKFHEQKKFISSPRIRLALRCSCPLNDKQQQQFDEIFSSNDQNTNIAQRILDECLSRLTTNNTSNTLIILSGQYHEVQTTILSTTLTRLYQFTSENLDKDLILRLNIQEFFNNKTPTCLLSSNDYLVSSPNETIDYLNNLCSNDHSNPLLITFLLQTRSSNTLYALLNILCTNETDNERTKEQFSHLLMSLSLSYSSNRQKQKKENNRTSNQALSSLLNDYITKHFIYIFANVKNEKQLKYWTKIQRLLRMKRNRLKMSRDLYDGTIIDRHKEEIWIDGPLSSAKEIWIDGPREFCSHTKQIHSRAKPLILSPKPSILSSTMIQNDSSSINNNNNNNNNFDTESIISSHCHLPVLPVFKDHSLLPFRLNDTLPRTKSSLTDSNKVDFKLSTNQLNDDMELLEKTLETLLIPSPIVPISNDNDLNMNQSVQRIDQLSSLMSTDEKSKRLSRIVSPTRFEKIFMDNQSSTWLRSPSTGSSVPNSPAIQTKIHHPRMPSTSISMTGYRTFISTKKPKIFSESNRQTSATRPTLFQRLFGLRSFSTPRRHAQHVPIFIESSTSSPLISPLTVTLDSRDDLMPLTTSSTTSSASGRASSSGYESMSNTVLDEMIASIPAMINSENKLKNKSTRKDERESNTNAIWNSPNLRERSQRQQRLVQLKHRQNELKLELAMTKNFLLMDKTKNNDHSDSATSTIGHNSMHQNLSNTTTTTDEDELEKEIDHLERRLATARSQLILLTSQKSKSLKC